MSTTLLKGHFQTPAFHEIAEDLLWCLGRRGAKDDFGEMPAIWITRQHPADGQGVASRAVPEGCARAELHHSLSLAVPGEAHLQPVSFWRCQDLLQSRKPLAFDTGTTNGLLSTLGRWS